MVDRVHASAGHKLGQIVGDWFEEYVVLPLLQQVADDLRLYLDCRFRVRSSRQGDKILWRDAEGNDVDYDFVMELDGSDRAKGIPVAFFECFWRRGARHSKDKARDDTGKLVPMRGIHPTARFLGIVAGGDFTAPARTLVQSRQVDLFYIPKSKIVSAFDEHRLPIDYPDGLPEPEKAKLADLVERGLTSAKKALIALRKLVGKVSLDSYVDSVRAALGSLPQEIRLFAQRASRPVVFDSIAAASTFLDAPKFDFAKVAESYVYQITYTDGAEFERTLETIDAVKALHREIQRLAAHMATLRS